MKIPFIFIILILGIPAFGRDPFWPIGYMDQTAEVVPEVQPTPVPAQGNELNQEELRQLADMEVLRIKESIAKKGTLEARGEVYVYVGGDWRTTGETITVMENGRPYKFILKKVTKENIELEAVQTALQNQPRK